MIKPLPSPSIPSTRERILIYLQEHRTATVVGLSRAWGLTRADIRYHLSGLVDERLVELVPRDLTQPVGRGRPVQQYRLSAQSSPGNLSALCSAALTLLLDSLPDEEKRAKLEQLAEIMAGAPLTSPQGIQRFNQVVARLNQHAYSARWEAHAGGPRILLRGCPYAAQLRNHPELCTMDRLIIQKLLGLPVKQLARMDLEEGKVPACVFVITPTSESDEY